MGSAAPDQGPGQGPSPPAGEASDWELVRWAGQGRGSGGAAGGAAGGDDGRDEAFAALFRRHGSAVFSFLLRCTGDSGLAEDLTQETFLAAYRNLGCLRADRTARGSSGSLRPWLLKVSRNLARSHFRRPSNRERPGGVGSGERWVEDPAESVVRQDDAARVRRVVAALAPRYKEPLLLHYTGGLTHGEIASVLGLPVGTVATRLRRGLRLVAERLDGGGR